MKKIFSLALAALLVFSLWGCARPADTVQEATAAKMNGVYAPAPYPAAAPAAATEASFAMADTAANGEYGGLSAARGADGGALSVSGGSGEEKSDKIIYSADATVETTDFDGAAARIAGLVAEYGGWVESSSVNGSNYYDRSRGHAGTRSAFYAIRIPAERFNALMSTLPALGNVPYSYTYTENVSERYYDAEARLTAYTAQEKRLIEMMDMAESVEEVIAIEEKLTELRYQIESLQSSLNSWDRRVSYSLVNLSLQEVEEYTPQTLVQPSYGEKLLAAVKYGFESVGDFFAGLLLWFVEALPSLVLIFAALFALVKLFKLRKRAKAKKKTDIENINK